MKDYIYVYQIKTIYQIKTKQNLYMQLSVICLILCKAYPNKKNQSKTS